MPLPNGRANTTVLVVRCRPSAVGKRCRPIKPQTMNDEPHTRREQGRAVVLTALMVLSVFAMSVSFAGAAAASAENVSLSTESVAVDDDSAVTDIEVQADGEYTNYAYAIVNDSNDVVASNDATLETANNSTTFEDVDVSGLEAGNYTVYVEANDNASALTEGDSVGDFGEANASLTVDDTTDDGADDEPTGDEVEDGDSVSQSELGGSLFWAGQEVVVTNLTENENVQLRAVEGDGSTDLVEELSTNEDGEVTIDTEGLDGMYVLSGAGADADNEFEVAEQSLDASFEDDSVSTNGETSLNLDSIRGTYDVEVSSENLSQDQLQDIFGEDVNTTDDDDSVTIENAEGSHPLDFNGTDVDAGEYNFSVDVTDTDASDSASLEVTEVADANAEFGSSTYSEEIGDNAEFTVNMEGTDSTVVTIQSDDGNYWADLLVTAEDGEDQVNVSMNTYLAGQNDSDAFSAENGDAEVISERDLATNDSQFRLLPGALNLEAYPTDVSSAEDVPTTDDDRADTDDLTETSVATLVLNERSTGDASTAVAPEDADLGDAESINDAATAGSEVATDDSVVVGVDVSGVFGYLDSEEDISTALSEEGDLSFTVEQSNPERYTNPTTFDLGDDGVSLVQAEDDDTLYFVIDTSTVEGVEAGQEYDATFEVGENYVDNFTEGDDADAQTASTTFSVVERTIEVTGQQDDQDRLEIENSENATVTGQSSAAPGTDVNVRLRATGEDPFLLSQTVEVGENGTIDADFDLSDYQMGQNLTVTMSDTNGEDVQDQANAVLVESAQQPHSVTVTVEDQNGSTVSGAEVSAGDQNATTGDDGQATLELPHGEYTLTASADGQEGSTTFTVGNDTADEVTVTLGQTADGGAGDGGTGDGGVGEGDDGGAGDGGAGDGGAGDGGTGGDGADGGDGGDGGGENQPGFGIVVALIALLAAAGIATRRS